MTGSRSWLAAALGILLLGSGCATVKKTIETQAGVPEGTIDEAAETYTTVSELLAEITDEQEYYIGRAVAADILYRYPLLENVELTAYVNRVGRTVSLASSRPFLYRGYHFAILDTDEVNALAAPGGFIFITRGMLSMVPDEETLAAVLAHEVSHVAERHGLAKLDKSRMTKAIGILGEKAGRALNSEEIAQLTELYDSAVGEVVKTLLDKGYDRGQEEEADRESIALSMGMGYRPTELPTVLEKMAARSGGGGISLLRTHPSEEGRAATLSGLITPRIGDTSDPAPRTARFRRHLAGLSG